MAEPKDGASFFRKVVRFVANPATDWSEVATRPDEAHELEKSELKAMVERKRRNDFVRKREFDTLRKLRRDGLSPEQLAALGGSTRGADDSEARLNDTAMGARADVGVKAKIDEIEQQMVGEQGARDAPPRRQPVVARRQQPAPQHPSDFYDAPTEPAAFDASSLSGNANTPGVTSDLGLSLPPLPGLTDSGFGPMSTSGVVSGGLMPAPLRQASSSAQPLAQPTQPMSLVSEPRTTTESLATHTGNPNAARLAMEVSEVVHDPELDEAVIAFANADFTQAEQSLHALCKPQAMRHHHAETWHVLMDLYRATGQQVKFEAMALDYANQFGRSSPQWYSLPKRVADAATDDRPDTRGIKGDVGWVSPALLDADAVTRLRATTLQLPLPWVLDWTPLERVEPEAASNLSQLFRQWAPQPIDMRWLDGERLLSALQEAAPTGVRDADPAFWMARLEALRLTNRPDQFDECAIDYCVTFEVSPPSWESARCSVRASNSSQSTTTPSLSIVGESLPSFMETGIQDDAASKGVQTATLELSGQLAGDISGVLAKLEKRLGNATLVQVSCARLIRVDFIAAGDLLNWVLAHQSEGRRITFTDAHRLVALFFGAMGINEHARVQVPRD